MSRKRKRRSFTPEYKAEVVKLVLEGGRSIRQLSHELDLTETAVRLWVKQAEADSGKGPPGALTTEERDELRRLRKENKQLRQGLRPHQMAEDQINRTGPARLAVARR